MENTTEELSPKQEYQMKLEYRILRSKVIKILDTHFSKKSNKLENYDNKMKLMVQAFKAMKDQELLDKIEQPGFDKTIPTNIDYPFYKPDLKNIKYSAMSKRKGKVTLQPIKTYREPDIDALCEYLTYDEIDMICEDPIYFLGVDEYRNDPKLNNQSEWAQMLVKTQKMKYDEFHWRESHSKSVTTLNGGKSTELDKWSKMSTAHLGETKTIDYDSKHKFKQDLLDSYARRVKARNFTMNSLAKLRQKENDEQRKNLEEYWIDTYNRKLEKSDLAVAQREEQVRLNIIANQQQRNVSHQKSYENRKKITDALSYKMINYQIQATIKERLAQEKVAETVQKKIEKAVLIRDYRFRKPQSQIKVDHHGEY